MLPYMDYIQNAFYEATGWNQDNSYAQLTATARGTAPHSILNIIQCTKANKHVTNQRCSTFPPPAASR